VVGIFAIGSRQHGDGIAAEVFIEPAWSTSTTHHGSLVHGDWIVFVDIAGAELRRCCQWGDMLKVNIRHTMVGRKNVLELKGGVGFIEQYIKSFMGGEAELFNE
jgi:hypothetical protein